MHIYLPYLIRSYGIGPDLRSLNTQSRTDCQHLAGQISASHHGEDVSEAPDREIKLGMDLLLAFGSRKRSCGIRMGPDPGSGHRPMLRLRLRWLSCWSRAACPSSRTGGRSPLLQNSRPGIRRSGFFRYACALRLMVKRTLGRRDALPIIRLSAYQVRPSVPRRSATSQARGPQSA